VISATQGRFNLLLGTVAFAISSAGSVLLHIVLAIAIYAKTRSGLLTSFYISLQWLPALLVVLYRSDWEHGMNPRVRWYLLDLVAAVLTLPILLFLANSNYLAIVILLIIRGLVDQANRINKTVAARVLFPPDKTTHYASFLQTGYHVGIGCAAVLGIFLIDRISMQAVVLIDALTFVISAALIYLTRCAVDLAPAVAAQRKSLPGRIADYRDTLRGDPRLFACAILMPLTATFFQGSYSVLQPIFPIEKLRLDAAAVSASYMLASTAIIVGSFSFSLFCKKSQLFDKPFVYVRSIAAAVAAFTAAVYVGCVWTDVPLVSAIAFTCMVIGFEFLWMLGYAGTVAFAPKGQLSAVFGISFALGCLLASFMAAAVGALLDYFDNQFVRLVMLLMTVFVTLILLALTHSKRAMQRAVPLPASLDAISSE
jgi:predicted MFS family arabinose efflux permease